MFHWFQPCLYPFPSLPSGDPLTCAAARGIQGRAIRKIGQGRTANQVEDAHREHAALVPVGAVRESVIHS